MENGPGIRTEECLANKGLLWSYSVDWNEPTKCGASVFITHLSTNNAVQRPQIQESQSHFEQNRDELIDETQHFDFYLMGGLNAKIGS